MVIGTRAPAPRSRCLLGTPTDAFNDHHEGFEGWTPSFIRSELWRDMAIGNDGSARGGLVTLGRATVSAPDRESMHLGRVEPDWLGAKLPVLRMLLWQMNRV